jgi:glycogen debranching enzyme
VRYLFLLCSFAAFAQKSIAPLIQSSEAIKGKAEFLHTPFVTAGDKLYLVGHQDGTFPPLGWHVKDEMGGIWAHPIKLWDGFTASYTLGGKRVVLDRADEFVNHPFANEHLYNGADIQVRRFQFVPDGKAAVYVEYVLENKTNQKQEIQFSMEAISNLRPVWLGERTGMEDGADQLIYENNQVLAKDAKNHWFAVMGASQKAISNVMEGGKKQNTALARTSYAIQIPAHGKQSISFVFSGSSVSKEAAIGTNSDVLANGVVYAQAKKERYEKLASQSDIQLSDAKLTQAMRWLKYNADWLINDVDGIGRGITAGMPDYPWFFGGDMTYSLQGLISSGRKDVAYSTIDLIAKLSEKTNGNGRIVHEVSSNGSVFNPGNVNETPQFASLIYKVYCWTGDQAFLAKHFPVVKKGLEWLMLQDKDHNLIPDGNGMMEIQGLDSEMIDVAAYSAKAYLDASKMASELGQADLARQYAANYESIRLKINTDFWVPSSNSYADFLGTKSQALRLTQEAIERASGLKNDWAVAELRVLQNQITANPDTSKRGFVLHHNWVVNTPMETGLSDPEKAVLALKTAEKFRNKFGMYVTGIDRSANSEKAESYAAKVGKSEFTYTGTVMTLPTGVQAISENKYGHPDQAYDLVQRMLHTFSFALPGSIYEVSPDYGMMTQAWNSYAFEVPVIQQFFGIQPLAYKKEIHLQPSWPDSLNAGSIKNVEIGDNAVAISYVRGAKKSTYILHQKKPWTMYFSPKTGTYKRWVLDGEIVKPSLVNGRASLRLKGWRHHLVLIE